MIRGKFVGRKYFLTFREFSSFLYNKLEWKVASFLGLTNSLLFEANFIKSARNFALRFHFCPLVYIVWNLRNFPYRSINLQRLSRHGVSSLRNIFHKQKNQQTEKRLKSIPMVTGIEFVRCFSREKCLKFRLTVFFFSERYLSFLL